MNEGEEIHMSLSAVLVSAAIAVSSSAVSYALQEKLEEGTFYRIDTNMKDESILERALKNYGCDVMLDNESFQSSLGDVQLAFQKQEDGTLSSIFSENVSTDDATEFLKEIQKEYTHIVQKDTYEKLMQRAEQEGLQLETETTNEDETIVLTFQVKENFNYE